MDDYVQYIVVRKDLNMSIGKCAAQVAHGSLGVLLEKKKYIHFDYGIEEDGYGELVPKQKTTEKVEIINDEAVEKWLKSRFTKLITYVKSKETLLNLAEKLDIDRLRYIMIYDRCLTELVPEEKNLTTLTCMGIIPIKRNEVPKYLRKLQLL